ncbi:hypothetical protein ACSS6W_010843 [Trichoderma asperelloides]
MGQIADIGGFDFGPRIAVKSVPVTEKNLSPRAESTDGMCVNPYYSEALVAVCIMYEYRLPIFS